MAALDFWNPTLLVPTSPKTGEKWGPTQVFVYDAAINP